MRRFALLLLTTGLVMFGQANHDLGYDDTPMLPGLPFHVHDPKRPHPPVVTPAAQAGGAPSDAIVLFDGKDLSQWQSGKGNWKVTDGYFQVVPGAGDLATKQKFGDVQLHVEWAAPVEIASALARLVRMKQLDSSDWSKARKLAKRLADSWSVIQPSNVLRAKSIQLVERYDLRAADSFQLAAALEWCEDAPQGRVFLTTAQKLREAALLSGFDAKPL